MPRFGFARKNKFHSAINKVEKDLNQLGEEYKSSKIGKEWISSITLWNQQFEGSALPLTNDLLKKSKQINFLLKSVSTSFNKIINDPTLDQESQDPKLSLRQLTAYKNMLQANKKALMDIKKEAGIRKSDLRGTYKVLRDIKGEFEKLGDRLKKARNTDNKMHDNLMQIDGLMAKISENIYP